MTMILSNSFRDREASNTFQLEVCYAIHRFSYTCTAYG